MHFSRMHTNHWLTVFQRISGGEGGGMHMQNLPWRYHTPPDTPRYTILDTPPHSPVDRMNGTCLWKTVHSAILSYAVGNYWSCCSVYRNDINVEETSIINDTVIAPCGGYQWSYITMAPSGTLYLRVEHKELVANRETWWWWEPRNVQPITSIYCQVCFVTVNVCMNILSQCGIFVCFVTLNLYKSLYGFTLIFCNILWN